MSALTITHDGTTGELLAHIAELQRKAQRYDLIVRDIQQVWSDLVALDKSYLRSVPDASNPDMKAWYEGKAQAFAVSASKIQQLLELNEVI